LNLFIGFGHGDTLFGLQGSFGLWTVFRNGLWILTVFSGFGFGFSFKLLDQRATKIIVSSLIKKSKTTLFFIAFFPVFIVK